VTTPASPAPQSHLTVAELRRMHVTIGTIRALLLGGRTRDQIIRFYSNLTPQIVDELIAHIREAEAQAAELAAGGNAPAESPGSTTKTAKLTRSKHTTS